MLDPAAEDLVPAVAAVIVSERDGHDRFVLVGRCTDELVPQVRRFSGGRAFEPPAGPDRPVVLLNPFVDLAENDVEPAAADRGRHPVPTFLMPDWDRCPVSIPYSTRAWSCSLPMNTFTTG